jgi:hypothetical protein
VFFEVLPKSCAENKTSTEIVNGPSVAFLMVKMG